MKKHYPILLFLGLCLTFFSGHGQSTRAQKIAGHYQYKYVIPYNIKEGAMLFSETGTMDFYKNGHGLDSARQVYRLITQKSDTVFWTFNFVNQNNWRVDNDTLLYSGTPETFVFELLGLRTTNPDLESWARNYGDYILHGIRETIGNTEQFYIAKLNRKCLFLARKGSMLEFYR